MLYVELPVLGCATLSFKEGRGGYFEEKQFAFLPLFSLGGGREREIRNGSEEDRNGTLNFLISQYSYIF